MKRRKYPQVTARKACTGKRKYTRAEAFEAGKYARFTTGDRIGSYKCKFCNRFHIGHTPYHIRQIIDNK